MIALGVWQLGRADEKEALIAQYEASIDDPQPTFGSPNDPEELFRRIETYCEAFAPSQPKAGRNAKGQSGWVHVVSCEIGGPDPNVPIESQAPDFVIESADVVIGWSREPTSVNWEGGMVKGVIVPGSKIVADPPFAGLEPNAKPDPSDLPNNHLAYAGQWFFFALTALVIYAFALRRRREGQADGQSPD